jgi:hypothetical protein
MLISRIFMSYARQKHYEEELATGSWNLIINGFSTRSVQIKCTSGSLFAK